MLASARRRSALLLLPLVFSLGLVESAVGQYRPGDQVVVIANEKLVVDGRQEVDDVWPGLVLKVQDVNGDWLWLSNGKPGWLKAKHVIPFDRAAIERLTAMIAREPRSANLYGGRADIWQHLGELDIAIADCNEAIRLNPNSAAYYNNRGIAWRVKGEYDKAIADFNEALRLDPKYAWAYFSRAVAKFLQRQPGAIDDCQQTIDLGGDLAAYSIILGHLAARAANETDRAERFLAQAKNLKPDWPRPIITYLAGEIDEPALLKLATDNDQETEARGYLGVFHALAGRASEARAHLRWVQEQGNRAFIQYTIAVAELQRLDAASRP